MYRFTPNSHWRLKDRRPDLISCSSFARRASYELFIMFIRVDIPTGMSSFGSLPPVWYTCKYKIMLFNLSLLCVLFSYMSIEWSVCYNFYLEKYLVVQSRCIVNSIIFRFDSHLGKLYKQFSVLCSGKKTIYGVELRRSIRNVSKI